MTERGPTSPDRDPLVALAADLRADASRLARATQAAGQRWRLMHYWLGGPAAVTAAVAGVSAIQSSTTAAAAFAVASAILTALTTWLNPGATAGSFLQTSRQYAALASRIGTLLRLELEPVAPHARGDAAKAKLIELQEELHRIRDGSPEVPPWALRRAAPSGLAEVIVAHPPTLPHLPWR